MEMGRMYQLKGEYRKAMKCTLLHEKSAPERNPSGLACVYFHESVSLYRLREASNAYMAVLFMLEGLCGRDEPAAAGGEGEMAFGGAVS